MAFNSLLLFVAQCVGSSVY